MFFIQTALLAISALATLTVADDAAGYHLPTQGTASTTQFFIGPEFAGGTSCGASGLPHAKKTSGKPGGGPGYLYAAINQRGFGANPYVPGAGGPGAACDICYELTPISAHGVALTAQSLTFMIVDECPADARLSGSHACTQCSVTDVNDVGQHWHFDIAPTP